MNGDAGCSMCHYFARAVKTITHVLLGVEAAVYQSAPVGEFIGSCCVAATSRERLQFGAFVTTQHSLLRSGIHHHHSAAEDEHMLWQQIRHSKRTTNI